MNELLRFTSTGTDGVEILFPPKYDFVFYEDKLTLAKNGKFVRNIMYKDIKETTFVRSLPGAKKGTVILTCPPQFGLNIYKVNEDTYNRIREILAPYLKK